MIKPFQLDRIYTNLDDGAAAPCPPDVDAIVIHGRRCGDLNPQVAFAQQTEQSLDANSFLPDEPPASDSHLQQFNPGIILHDQRPNLGPARGANGHLQSNITVRPRLKIQRLGRLKIGDRLRADRKAAPSNSNTTTTRSDNLRPSVKLLRGSGTKSF